MEKDEIITAIRALATAFEGESAVSDMAFDISRIADDLNALAECVRHDRHGNAYFCTSPDVD